MNSFIFLILRMEFISNFLQLMFNKEQNKIQNTKFHTKQTCL